MQALGILGFLGFVCILASWCGMFFRVRRSDPGRGEAQYANYIGGREFRTRGMHVRLVRLYLQRYGADGWFWLFVGGVMMVAILIIASFYFDRE